MSRVPVFLSMMPTTRKSVALNAACATSTAERDAGETDADQGDHEAQLTDGPVREEQLQVVLAQCLERSEGSS